MSEPPAPPRANGPAARPAAEWSKTAVRYGAMSWVGEFSYRNGAFSRCGAKVVVQSERGIELGQQLELFCIHCGQAPTPEQIRRYVDSSGPEFYRPAAGRILREATPQDIDEHQRLNAHVGEDVRQCAALAREHGLDLKVVTAEHLLGGERIVFYFVAEGRVDFRELVKELARRYRTRIEMRQVGARDEARLVADFEVCGRECCCRSFLKTLRPVNMKMAKLQKSTLDPSKVSGRCGRLRCCLRYEHQGYVELAAKLPRKGTRIATRHGSGTVVDALVLTQLVLLRRDDGQELVVAVEDITALNLPRLPTPPDEGPPRSVRPPRSGGSIERPAAEAEEALDASDDEADDEPLEGPPPGEVDPPAVQADAGRPLSPGGLVPDSTVPPGPPPDGETNGGPGLRRRRRRNRRRWRPAGPVPQEPPGMDEPG